MFRERCWAATLRLVPRRHRWTIGAIRGGRLTVGRHLLADLAEVRGGNYPDVALLYTGERHEYLNERERETRSGKINGAASIFLDDKIAFELAMPSGTTPEVLGLVVRGRLTTLDGRPLEVGNVLDRANHVVLRPVRGRKGKGVSFVQRRSESLYLNGRPITQEDFQDHVARLDYHLISRFVQQHPYAAEVFAHSVNTLRILSMRDPLDGEAFVAAAFHRFGTVRSAPVDNFSAGGLSVAVDLESGQLGSGLTYPALADSVHHRQLRWFDSHPDTGAIIKGRVVPDWPGLLDTINEAMNALPMIHYVGWDVVQTRSGPQIIEGNNLPDLRGTQVHGGLLRNERALRFYRHFGIAP